MISAAWLVSCVLLAQPEQSASPSVELPATVKRLARQLDDSQLAKRDAAEKDLIALGPDALNFLPQITAKTPAEVKDRLGRVRKTLEAAAVEAATKPSLVTLQGEMSLADARQLSARDRRVLSGNAAELLDEWLGAGWAHEVP